MTHVHLLVTVPHGGKQPRVVALLYHTPHASSWCTSWVQLLDEKEGYPFKNAIAYLYRDAGSVDKLLTARDLEIDGQAVQITSTITFEHTNDALTAVFYYTDMHDHWQLEAREAKGNACLK